MVILAVVKEGDTVLKWPMILPQEKDQPTFDASEFPALGGSLRGQSVSLPNGDGSSNVEGANLYANLSVHKGMLPSEFNIQSEEFPALPGASASNRAGAEDRQQGGDQQAGPSNQVRSLLSTLGECGNVARIDDSSSPRL